MKFSKFAVLIVVLNLLLSSCGAGQVFGPTMTPTPTTTNTPTPTKTPTPTNTSTPMPTNTPTLTPTATLTPQELYEKIAPVDFEYGECLTINRGCYSYSGEWGDKYKMSRFNAFFTGYSRQVERFDNIYTGTTIFSTEIQVAIRDTSGNVYAMWLPLGSNDFKINQVQKGCCSIITGTTSELLALIHPGSKIGFSVLRNLTPPMSESLKTCALDNWACDYRRFVHNSAIYNKQLAYDVSDGRFPDQSVLDDAVIPVANVITFILED